MKFMRIPPSFVFILLPLLFFNGLACKPKKLENGNALSDEVERLTTVQRITEKQILAEALRLGDSLTGLADSLAQHRLTQSLQKGGLWEALSVYPPQGYAEVQALAKKVGARPGRQALTDAALPEKAEVRLSSNTELLYTRPIYLNDASCLRCHGTAIAAADARELQQLKPLFTPSGLPAGAAVGTWVIPITRKGILESLSYKVIRKYRRDKKKAGA